MNLRFTKLTVEGFQSIGKETSFDLEGQGMTIIKGINEYEAMASSNGSGKSSLVEALCWCLFGKTSAGVANVNNRYYDDGCSVTVELKKDNESYLIQRTLEHVRFKTMVKVVCNGNDISCRNKSDSDKLIKDEILPFNQDVFLSTIFLSQGFSGRLSSLAPSARKERLEILANMDASINEFKNQVNDKKSVYSDSYRELDRNVSYLSGKLDTIIKDKESAEKLSQVEVDIPDISVEEVTEKLADVDKTIEQEQASFNEMKKKSNDLENRLGNLTNEMSRNNKEKKNLESQIEKMNKSFECPTCHQTVSADLGEEIKAGFQTKIDELDDIIFSQAEERLVTLEELDSIEKELTDCDARKQALLAVRKKTNDILQEYNEAVRKNSVLQGQLANLAKIDDYNANILNISEEIQQVKDKQSEVEINLGVTDHMLKLITKEFRTFLLTSLIDYMNSKLAKYSEYLFESEEDKIWVSSDSSKLTIMLNDSLYESLSGGEKKKVDLALVLAQRDLALKTSGFKCNILVLDEILENMDETASNVSLKLLTDMSEEIESMYLISHNNYSLPIDNTITVIKGTNKVSRFLFS